MSNPVGAQRYGVGGGDAYYDAVKYGGYTGTREQFGRDQAEFAENATAVAQAREEVERNTQTVMNTAQTFTEETVPAAIQSVEEKGDTEEDRLEARTTELVQSINTAGAVQVQAVEDEGTEQIRLVSGAGTAQVEAVEQAGSDQVDAVELAGSTQVENVNNAGTTQVGNVNSAGTTQVGNVNTAGAAQVQRVQDKGDEVLDSIPSDYTTLDQEVDSLNQQLSATDHLLIGDGESNVNIWEEGSISGIGGNTANSARIRTKADRKIGYNEGQLYVSCADGYEMFFPAYNQSGTYIGRIQEDGKIGDAAGAWLQSVNLINYAEYLFRIVLRNKTDPTANISVSEAVNVLFYFEKYAAKTDEDYNAFYLENVTPARSSGILDRWNNSISTGEHYSIPVAYGERYWLLGYKWGSDYAGYYLRKNGAIVSYDNTTPTGTWRNWDVTIPDGVDELYLNSNYSFGAIYKKVPCRSKPDSKWAGKKIVWFGTSIPERSTYNAIIGYPEYVGKLLGATIYNEAVGSSCARRGFKAAESADDPYGWTGMGQAALWNMGSTIAEKNEIITNWESKWRNLTGYNVSMTDAISAKALACSYENKLVQKYIIDNPVDLYVFDHGYNDWKTGNLDMNANDPFDMSTFQGAMNTYIKLILEANPRARIVIISHYEDQERAGLIEMQKDEAEYWNLPFCKIYKKLGWANNRQITTTGYWSNGIWIESGGTSQTLSLKQYHMPDGRHPNEDRTGRACMDIANIIADYIDSIAPAN